MQLSSQQKRGAAACRLTTRTTCGAWIYMETVTHLLLVCCVYSFKWDHLHEATEPLAFIVEFLFAHSLPMQQATEEGKINIIKTLASSSLPNVASVTVPDTLTTRRPCEPAACLKLCRPVVKAWAHFLTLPGDGVNKQGHIAKVSHRLPGRKVHEFPCVSDTSVKKKY